MVPPRNSLSIFSQRNLERAEEETEMFLEEMVMINEEGDRAKICNVNGGGRDDHYQHQLEEDLYDKDFPTGYRFRPTDEELIKYYLFRKVNSFQLPPNRFEDVNIYSNNPWELAARYETYGESIHYLFSPREKKYPNGRRPNRAAGVGYWKACGADKPICDEITNKKLRNKRVLVFYRGKPPKGEKTNWIMHEYTIENPNQEKEKKNGSCSSSTTTGKKKKPCPDSGNPENKQLDEFVLCKLYLKLGKSTKDTMYQDHDDPCEDMNEESDTAVDDASPPPSIATATSAAVAVPDNQQHMHQTAVVAAVDHQYPVTSMVVAAAAEGMVPLNHHQYALTWKVSTAAPEEMKPYNSNYSDNINPFSLEASSSAMVPSVNPHYHGEMTQQQLQADYDFKMFIAEWNYNFDSQSNFLGSAGFSKPDLETDVGRK